MYWAIVKFENSFLNIVTITFTSLIVLESLNVISEVQRVKPLMILSIFVTLIIYFGSIWLLPNYMEVSYINWKFMG